MTVTRDAVQAAIAGPIDWSRFEQIAYEILINDDMPALTKLGGVADQGADAIRESFYRNERRVEAVVQVTSETTQRYKLSRTIKRLQETNTIAKSLVIVFRQPVLSGFRSEMIDSAMSEGVALEIRDQDYLVAQLGKEGSTIFSRNFGSAKEQLEVLLAQRDPLDVAGDRQRHSMLATLRSLLAESRRETG